MNTDSRTLVIGGGGYIGSYLIPALISSGRTITVLGRRDVSDVDIPQGVTYIKGDFSEKYLISKLLDEHEDVIHLAYATIPNTSYEDPLADLLQNLPPTVQLFSELAERQGRLVLVSSGGTVYGEAVSIPIREDHPTRPISPYGVTKLTLENYAQLYAVTHGLKYSCIRPANAYGAGQRPFVGQGFISTAMASAMRGRPIKIFGKTGTVRDYIYASDLAAGVISVLDKGRLSEIYNLGSGNGLSNMDVIKAMSPLMEEIGVEISVEHLPERVFDVKTNILDSSKLQEHTGWEPVVDFDEGLIRTRDWLRASCR